MTSTTQILPNPLLKYSNLTNSSDLVATNIVINFTSIYNNYVIFCNQNDNPTDLSILDTAATNIQNSFNNIVTIITPCIIDSTPYNIPIPKCTANNNCFWASDIERIFVDFLPLLIGMSMTGVKKQYQFVSFFIIQNFIDLITKNQSNFSPIDNKYYLCANIPYNTRSTDPKLQAEYNAMTARMNVQLTSKNTRQADATLINFLLYILLPTVIFIILILMYIHYSKKSEDNVVVTPSPVTLNISTTESPPHPKAGGRSGDTLQFITRMGLQLFTPK